MFIFICPLPRFLFVCLFLLICKSSFCVSCQALFCKMLENIFPHCFLSCLIIQLLSHVQLFATSWTAAHQASMSFTISQSLHTSCRLNQRFHPTVSSSVAPFFSCPQSFPESGSFLVSLLFTSGGQSIGVSASAPVLPMNIWG